MSNPFQDPGASKLLSRVRDDISLLRGDVAKLLSYTTRYTLPKGAREIAGSARQGLSAGRTYAAQRIRSIGSSAPRQAAGVAAGAAIVGLLRAFGPPTLSIASDGSGRYVLPWRTRAFQIAPGSRIVVGRLGTRFDPPLETPQGPLSSINLRLSWADHSADRLAARLADLNPGWTVSTR